MVRLSLFRLSALAVLSLLTISQAQEVSSYRVINVTLDTSSPSDLRIDRGRLIWKDLDQSAKFYLKLSTGAEIVVLDSQLTSVRAALGRDHPVWNAGNGSVKLFDLRSWLTSTIAGDAYNGTSLQPVSVSSDRAAFTAVRSGGSVIRLRNLSLGTDSTFDDAVWNLEPSTDHRQLAWVTSASESPSAPSSIRFFDGKSSRTVSDSNSYANRSPILRDHGIVWLQYGSRARVKALVGDSLFTLAEAGSQHAITGYDIGGGIAVAAVTDTSADTSSVRIFLPATGTIRTIADPDTVSGLHTDNGKVVWVSGKGGSRQLNVHDVAGNSTEQLGIAADPVIDDDHIAWTLGDAVTIRVPVTYERLTTDQVNGWLQRRFKTIDNSNVLWGNHADAALPQSTNPRMFYAGTTPARLSDSLIYKDFVTVNDGQAVWRQDFTNLYIYDGANPPAPKVTGLQCENMYVADGSVGFHGFKTDAGNSINQAWIYRINDDTLIQLSAFTTGDTTAGITLVDGSEAMWMQKIGSDFMLMHYNGTSSVRITDSTISDKFGFVDGVMVWSEVENGVYQIKMRAAGGGTVQLTSGSIDALDPFTDGLRIAWFEYPAGGATLVYYDIAKGTTTRVAHAVNPLVHWLWMSDGRIGWAGGDEVRIFDGEVTSQLTNSGDFTPNSEVYVDDGTVVWKQQSVSPGFPVFGDIFRGKLTPQAAFDAVNIAGAQPLSVTFRNRSWQGDESYLWDFGDGQSSTLPEPMHTYANPGKYTVTLTVTGPGGTQSVETKHKLVRVGLVTSAEGVESGIPTEFRLSTGFPNPFNGLVNFEMRTAQAGLVDVRVYDMLGREIALLMREELVPGVHSLQWNSGHIASGVYLIRMQAQSAVQAVRVVLVK